MPCVRSLKGQAMRRREFISLIGCAAAALPLTARAQQPAMPVIGLLNNTSPEANADLLRAFRQGLKDTGFVEGENVAVDYRWADNQLDRPRDPEDEHRDGEPGGNRREGQAQDERSPDDTRTLGDVRHFWPVYDESVPTEDDVERKARKGRKENRSALVGPVSADTVH